MSFLDRFKLYGNKVKTLKNTRRAVLTKFGFIIESDIEVEDHPEFLKKKSDIESRSNEMATKHDKEVWTYIAQGFPGSKERPSAEMVGQRLKTNPDFRSGLLKLQDRHKTEYAALKGELKSAVEDNEIYKQEARSEQVRSMTSEQKRELVGEKSRARYQTEEGKLDRQYRNINHYGRQGERIKTVQRTRYLEDEDFRAKQIERSKLRLQKPGIKELGAAEARERTRLRNNPLNEQCDCGCNGNLKTHRANFRKKFWSEYNPVKEGGFKILIAGIDNDAYWSGESWRRCLIAGGNGKAQFSKKERDMFRQLPISTYQDHNGTDRKIFGTGKEAFHGTSWGSEKLKCQCRDCLNFATNKWRKKRNLPLVDNSSYIDKPIQKNIQPIYNKETHQLEDIHLNEAMVVDGKRRRTLSRPRIKTQLENLHRSHNPDGKLTCGLCNREIKKGSPTHLDHTTPFSELNPENKPEGQRISGLNDLEFTHINCHKQKSQTILDTTPVLKPVDAKNTIKATQIYEIMKRAPKVLGTDISDYIDHYKSFNNKSIRNLKRKRKNKNYEEEVHTPEELRGYKIYQGIRHHMNNIDPATSEPRKEEAINWERLLTDPISKRPKIKTKIDPETGHTLVWQKQSKRRGPRSEYIRGTGSNSILHVQDIKSEANALEYKDVLSRRKIRNPELYEKWTSNPKHRLTVCNDCGKDSAQLGSNLEIDHDSQELTRYPEEGRFMDPITETEVRCGNCHETAQIARDQERKQSSTRGFLKKCDCGCKGGTKTQQLEDHMKIFALNYREKMGRKQNKSWGRGLKTLPGEFKESSWNGFKALNNL